MSCLNFSRAILVLLLTIAAADAAEPKKPAAKPATQLPKWEAVERAARASLCGRQDYHAGDILARSEAQSCMAQLATLGWKPTNATELVAAVPGDDEFIVKHLRGKNNKDGQRFMRHVASYPDGYDRLDRMIRMPRGEIITEDLIHNPGGYRMVEYLATAQGGQEMGKMLSDIPQGRNFNQPTGRIYTAEQLLGWLKASYAADTAPKKTGR